MRLITKDGRAKLRQMAFEATAREGALAVMPDTMLAILDLLDLYERQRDEARQRLANRVESPVTPDVPAREEVAVMVSDEREGTYTESIEREDVPGAATREAKDADVEAAADAERKEDAEEADPEGEDGA